MNSTDLGERFCLWVDREPSIAALVEIGSRVRAGGDLAAADHYSDWDFQVVTSRPQMFATRAWLAHTELQLRPLAYVCRTGRLGSAAKVTALFSGGELDLVIIPASRLRMARGLVALGLASRLASLRRGLEDLAVVLRDGFQLRKGGEGWQRFLQRVAREFVPALMSPDDLCAIAEGFVCDYVSTRRKIARGEFLAAQRWIHHQLVETNFRLLHQLRRGRGDASFPDARRIELLAPARAGQVAAETTMNALVLDGAAQKSAETLRGLMHELVGDAWRWPTGID